MDEVVLEATIRSKADVAGFEKATLATQNLEGAQTKFGGALTKQESAYAAQQLSLIKTTEGHKKYGEQLEKSVVITGHAGEITGGLARKMQAFNDIGLTPTTAGLIGATAALGLLVEGGKSMIENAEKNEVAQNSLKQAFESQGLSLDDNQARIDEWLKKNAAYIDNQYAAKEAIASVTRAGFDQTAVQRLMNDALDLAAIKHISLTDATHQLILAEMGNTRALKDMGISQADALAIFHAAPNSLKDVAKATTEVEKATTAHDKALHALALEEDRLHAKRKVTAADLDVLHAKQQAVKDSADKLTKANGDLSNAQTGVVSDTQSQAKLLDLLEPKLAKGRDTTSELTQRNRELSQRWEDISNRYGPGLISILSGAVGAVTSYLDALGNSSKWNEINNFLTWTAGNIHALVAAWDSWTSTGGGTNTGNLPFDRGGIGGGRASGGPVDAGMTYLVGEKGPELLTMGGNGYVTPNDQLSSSSSGASVDTARMESLLEGILVTLQSDGGDARTGMSSALYQLLSKLDLDRSRGMVGAPAF